MTIADLNAQKNALARQLAELDSQLQALRNQDRMAAIAQIKAQMLEHGLTIADLGVRNSGSSAKAAVDGRRTKAPIKYRHPESGETWTGRGLHPRWLIRELNNGIPLAHFKVD